MMAFAMTTQGPSTVFKPQPPQVSGVIPPVQIADTAFTTTRASGTTAAQNLSFGCTTFQVIVYIKTLVLGANTGVAQGPVISVEVADVTGAPAKKFARVVVDPSGMGAGSSGTFDALIMAEP